MPDYLDHFWDTNFKPSKLGQGILSMPFSQISEANQKFLELNKPFRCLAETKKTRLGLVGRDYFTVEPLYALLEPKTGCTLLPNSNHVDMSRLSSRDDQLYKELISLIADCKFQ